MSNASTSTSAVIALALAAACRIDVPVAADASGVGVDDDADTAADVATSTGAAASSSSTGGARLDLPDDASGESSCPNDDDRFWVLAIDPQMTGYHAQLYRFDPVAASFEWVSALDCVDFGGFGDLAFSIAVSRDARAYLSSPANPALLELPLLEADACAAASVHAGSAYTDYRSFGFAALDPDNPELETLFTASHGFRRYGKVRLDLPDAPVEDIAEAISAHITLTGTGDGRMFAVVTWDSGLASLVQLEPTTGAVIDTLAEVDHHSHVAFYAGDLFVFANRLTDGSLPMPIYLPHVVRTSLDDPDHVLTEVYGPDDDPAPMWIGGIASPTCVPTAPAG